MKLTERIRDWWRGYSEADVDSLLAKLQGERRPYAIIPITAREMRAICDERAACPRCFMNAENRRHCICRGGGIVPFR